MHAPWVQVLILPGLSRTLSTWYELSTYIRNTQMHVLLWFYSAAINLLPSTTCVSGLPESYTDVPVCSGYYATRYVVPAIDGDRKDPLLLRTSWDLGR